MADILIKNMEMPKEGNVYLIIGEDGVVSKKIGSMYHVTTEAIELPPHGDLIDRNELLKLNNITYIDTGHWMTDYEAVKTSVINNAPSIVEASE